MISITLKGGSLILNLAAISSAELGGTSNVPTFTIWMQNGMSYTLVGPDVKVFESAAAACNAVLQTVQKA